MSRNQSQLTALSAKYVSEQMRHETSFVNEAANARRCAQLLAQTPELKDDIYIPKVFGKAEGCVEGERIMVMEWVDGCRYASPLGRVELR